jgi:hypothetical protein
MRFDKPHTHHGDLDHLPAALRPLTEKPAWLNWSWEYANKKSGGNWSKPPYDPKYPKQKAKTNDPATWGTFEEALRRVNDGEHDGFGYALCGTGLGAVDMDHCRDASGALEPWAERLIEEIPGAYVEITPSGAGIRILGRASGTEIHRRFPFDRNGMGIEIYRDANRYITISGLEMGKCSELPAIDEALDGLLARYGAPGQAVPGLDFASSDTIQLVRPDLADVIENGAPVGERSDEFGRVVWSLAAQGMSAEEIAAELARHPDGIAAKYGNRLQREVNRCYSKWQAERQAQAGGPILLGRSPGAGPGAGAGSGAGAGPSPGAAGTQGGRGGGGTGSSAGTGTQQPGATPGAQGGTTPQWQTQYQKYSSGLIIPNLANVMLTLRNDPAVRDILGYDQMYCGEILMASIGVNKSPLVKPTPVTDVDVTAIQEWFQRERIPILGPNVLHAAVNLRARERSFHPVRICLDRFVWNGTLRVERMLPVYFGAVDNEYTRAVGCMFMIAAVKRIYEPGCQCDYMLVLEGEEQGEFKSSACRVLGGEWFSDHLPDLATGGKDVSQHIRGKWIIEVGEMHAMSTAADTRLKSFLSRTIEQYRPSYGKRQVHEPRQCLFIGTTNKTEYLRDETGGRRYWPVRTGTIDLKGLERDRDQLFAEAKMLYEAGWPSYPSRDFERRCIKQEQEARREGDPWEDSIIPYLDGLPVGAQVTVTQVAEGSFNFLKDESKMRLGTSDQRRIAAILRNKKEWERQPRTALARFWIKRK